MSHPLSELRPLGVGEIIDRAATFWRQHFKTLFLMSLGFNLVAYIIGKAVQLVLLSNYSLIMDAARTGEWAVLAGYYARLAGAVMGIFVASFWLNDLNTLVVTRYMVPTQLGEPTSPAEGMRRALKRVGSLTGAYVLSLFWGVGATLLMMLPGMVLGAVGGFMGMQSNAPGTRVLGVVLAIGGLALGVIGALGGLLWYLLRFSLLAPVMAMEDLPAVRSFRRSGELLSGRVEPGFIGRVSVRAMLLVTVASLILLSVNILSGLPALILQFTHGAGFDPAAAAANPVPQSLLVPAELLQVVGQSLFNPLGLVVYATLYLDMRVRREGLDLEKRLEARA